MATYEIKNATSTHNINNLDKTIFDRDYSKENNRPNDNKIVQYYNLKDIKHDISSQFIILKNTDREVCPEIRVKLFDNLNYNDIKKGKQLNFLRVCCGKLERRRSFVRSGETETSLFSKNANL